MRDPTLQPLDPAAPGAHRFVSGARHAVQVRPVVWTPLVTYMEGHNLTNAYNLGLLAQFAYSGGTSGGAADTMESALTHVRRATTREGAVSDAIGDFVLRRARAVEAINPATFKFLHGATTETQGFAVSAGRAYTAVAFRGTEPSVLADWLRDGTSSARRYAWGPGEIHTGFLEGFLSVRDDLDAYLNEFWDPDSPIVLCGHSLGGALATVAATYVRATRTDRVMLYTYGSPRTGDRTVAREFTSRRPIAAHRHVVHADIVPRLPPPGFEAPSPRVESVGDAARRAIPFKDVLFVDVDLDPFWHIGELRYLTHLPSGGAAARPLVRATGPLGWEMGGWGALATYADVMESSWNELKDRVRGAVEPASHLVDDHSMDTSYLAVLRYLLHEAIRDFLSFPRPTAEQAAAFARLRAEDARLAAHVADLERRRRAALAEAARLRASVDAWEWPPDPRRVLERIPFELPTRLLPIGLVSPPEVVRARALEHAAAQWAVTIETAEGQRETLRERTAGVYRVQGSLAGYDPVPGLREELAYHIGETVPGR